MYNTETMRLLEKFGRRNRDKDVTIIWFGGSVTGKLLAVPFVDRYEPCKVFAILSGNERIHIYIDEVVSVTDGNELISFVSSIPHKEYSEIASCNMDNEITKKEPSHEDPNVDDDYVM